MRKFVLALLASFLSFIINAKVIFAVNKPQLGTDRVLVIVNNEPILASEFDAIFYPALTKFKQISSNAGQTKIKVNELRNFILNQQIEYILLRQEAKRLGIKVTTNEIQDQINQFRKIFNSEYEFNNELKKNHLTIDILKSSIKERLIIARLIQRSVNNKVKKPTDVDIRSFYNRVVKYLLSSPKGKQELAQNKDIITTAQGLKRLLSEHIKVRQIFVSVPKNVSVAQKKAIQTKLNNIKSALHKHQSFSSIALKYSDSPNNGNWGIIYINDLPSKISNRIFNMKVGNCTLDPIQTGNGYHFVKVEEKYAKKDINYNNSKKYLSDILYFNRLQKAYNEYIKSLRAKANIKINKSL
ncbi:MAG: SurA N-terminal domain-containing protein [Endomicrobium sp.]|jgi:parvulin-like peptidyl-prolyl isomerase|nr:SurA N-terminal domain-containing protein [Endomicrobium sp.]